VTRSKELRRLFWPRYEALAGAPGGQDIEGYLQAIFFHNFARFEERVASLTGRPTERFERRIASGGTLLTDATLDGCDTLIIISFDSKRTGQEATRAEVQSLRGFLARSNTSLFVCPHHDIGDTDDLSGDRALERQTGEYHHHGDIACRDNSGQAVSPSHSWPNWARPSTIGSVYDRQPRISESRHGSTSPPKIGSMC
jgi:hypothetical protein